MSGALRELLEETGYRPAEVRSLGSYAQIPAASSAKVHLFLVNCHPGSNALAEPEATEDLSVELVTRAELEGVIESGRMNCLACVAASCRALRYLDGVEG